MVMRIILTKHTSHLKESLEIAIKLPEYFTKEAIRNMERDFKKDALIVAEDEKIFGFLCFGIRNNLYEVLWMGVKQDKQSQGIGKALIDFLIQYLKDRNVKELYVKTLTPKDPYEPYKRTRKFYENNGFENLYTEKAKKEGWDDQVVMRLNIK